MSNDAAPAPNLADALNEAFADLTRTAAIVELLTDQEPDGFIRWGMALYEVLEARDALLQAPALPPQPDSPPDITAPEHHQPETVTELATTVHQTLTRIADDLAGPDDKLACFNAALHVARLRESLE